MEKRFHGWWAKEIKLHWFKSTWAFQGVFCARCLSLLCFRDPSPSVFWDTFLWNIAIKPTSQNAFWSICKSKCLMKKIWQNAFLVVEVTVLQNAPGCLSQEVDIIWGWRCHYDNLPSIDFIWIFMITSCPIPRVSSTSWEKVKRISSTFVYGNPMSDIYFMIFHSTNWRGLCL